MPQYLIISYCRIIRYNLQLNTECPFHYYNPLKVTFISAITWWDSFMTDEMQNIKNGKDGLRPCPHCRGEISVLANTCMYCGKPVPMILKNKKELILKGEEVREGEYPPSTHFVEALGSFDIDDAAPKKNDKIIRGKIVVAPKPPKASIMPTIKMPQMTNHFLSLLIPSAKWAFILVLLLLIIIPVVLFSVRALNREQTTTNTAITTASNSSNNTQETVKLSKGIELEMVWIPPGEFIMGANKEITIAGPAHHVTLTKGFWIGKYEVTKEQWKAVMGTEPWVGEKRIEHRQSSSPDSPAVWLTWDETNSFCKKLGDSYRLPTEAEWEHACRAGTNTTYFFGNNPGDLRKYAWYSENSIVGDDVRTQSVGQKLPNPWGLYDMHGGVWEWCQDTYNGRTYPSHPVIDPVRTVSGSWRVIRGGSFDVDAHRCRSTARTRSKHYEPHSFLGFRIAKTGSP